MLFETVSRAHPFAHQSAAETASAILDQGSGSLRYCGTCGAQTHPSEVLEKDRERRYQTMRDLVVDLESLARDLTAPAAAGWPPKKSRVALWTSSMRRCWQSSLAGAVWFEPLVTPPSTRTTSSSPTSQIQQRLPALLPMAARWRSSAGGPFLTRSGQIYVKQLPNGEAGPADERSAAQAGTGLHARRRARRLYATGERTCRGLEHVDRSGLRGQAGADVARMPPR